MRTPIVVIRESGLTIIELELELELPEILGQTGRVGAKSLIFYLFSPVAPQP